jgi:hypothetical protein
MQQRWLVVALVLGMAALSWAILIWPTHEPLAPLPTAGDAAPPALAAPPSAAVQPAPEPAAQTPVEPQPASGQEIAKAAAPSDPPAEDPPLFAHDVGPVDERRARFASEPRDSAASDAEALLRDAFKITDSPEPLLRSVLCRTRVCKLELQLRADQLGAYVAAMARITQHFDKQLAVTRTAQQPGQVSLEVYAERLPAQ